MGQVLQDNEHGYWERFACGCLDGSHALDVRMDYAPWELQLEFSTHYIPTYDTFWQRLGRAWAILRGREVFDHDILICIEDIKALAAAIHRAANISHD